MHLVPANQLAVHDRMAVGTVRRLSAAFSLGEDAVDRLGRVIDRVLELVVCMEPTEMELVAVPRGRAASAPVRGRWAKQALCAVLNSLVCIGMSEAQAEAFVDALLTLRQLRRQVDRN